jgi:ferredoxin
MWSPSFLSSASTSLLRLVPSSRHGHHLHRHRCLAAGTLHSFRSFSSKDSGVDPEIAAYMKDTAGIQPELHKGIVKAMQSVYGKNMSVANLEAFGATGIQALADSVEKEQKKSKGGKARPFKIIRFEIPHHKTEFDLKWKQGDSLLDLSQSSKGEELLMEYIEGTCNGQMSCCSCHVYVDETTFSALEPPCTGELDMLDLAYERKATSRLGCQVQLQDNLLTADHTITVTIPADVNNVWS